MRRSEESSYNTKNVRCVICRAQCPGNKEEDEGKTLPEELDTRKIYRRVQEAIFDRSHYIYVYMYRVYYARAIWNFWGRI